MCEFRADHDVTQICGRIVSNTAQVTRVFEAGAKRSPEDNQVDVKPRTRRLNVVPTE